MISINTHQAKTRLSKLLAEIEHNNEIVIICRDGKPIAQLHAWDTKQNPFKQNSKLKGVKFFEDPSLPLGKDEWPLEYR